MCISSEGSLRRDIVIGRKTYVPTSCLISQTTLSRLQNYCLDVIKNTLAVCLLDGCHALLITLKQFELIAEMSHAMQN